MTTSPATRSAPQRADDAVVRAPHLPAAALARADRAADGTRPPAGQSARRTSIALMIVDDFSMYHFRGDLIRSLVARGFDVTVIVPPGDYRDRLTELGARCLTVPMDRFISPFRDLKLLFSLYRLFRRERFDLVHNMTVKPNTYGTFAARAAGIRNVVCLVSGMGFVFSDSRSLRVRLLRPVICGMYRLGLALSRRTWFQNGDDRDAFIANRLISPDKALVIRSGGINLDEFSPGSVSTAELGELREELGIPADAHCAVMVAARLVWSKGVREFFEAADRLRDRLPDWRFVMLCPRDDDSPQSVPPDYIAAHQPDNVILVDTFRYDAKRFISLADVVVLPSFYPEGVPRTLLEALALAKPVVTTDHPGCREVVDEGRNGFLVPTRDVDLLADRLAQLAEDAELRKRCGLASREKARHEFSSDLVVDRIVRELYQL